MSHRPRLVFSNCGEYFDEKAQLELEMIFKRTDIVGTKIFVCII